MLEVGPQFYVRDQETHIASQTISALVSMVQARCKYQSLIPTGRLVYCVYVFSGAACEAAREGIPSVAFSGSSTKQVSFTTLTSSPNDAATRAALTYAQLTTTFTKALLASSARPILPTNVTVNVNFPSTSNCPSASNFKFVFTRLVSNSRATDVTTCGTNHLPVESTAINQGCIVTVSVMNAVSKSDVDATTQSQVLNRISSILSCLS